MSLISCPECGKEISDKAGCCIHCGYPIKKTSDMGLSSNLYAIVLADCGENKIKVIRLIREITQCDLVAAKIMVEHFPSLITKNLSIDEAENIKKSFSSIGAVTKIEEYKTDEDIAIKYKDDAVRCPRCGSASITTGQRGFSFWTGFLGSNKTVNRCAKCGYS